MSASAPLSGLRVIELGSIGPGPFCAMMLADHGADVIRVVRPESSAVSASETLHRSRPTLRLDLKNVEDLTVLRSMVANADVLIEGFRPGVLERLGLSPADLHDVNPQLVIGRMTGWGQTGPGTKAAGHDINYLAASGLLDALGRAGGKPTPPINLLADFGGGGLLLAFGILAALQAANRTGRGDVVDAAMVEGASLLSTMIWGYRGRGEWEGQRGENLLDTGAPFYDCYETADGRWIAIAPIEPQFWSQFTQAIGLNPTDVVNEPHKRSNWPSLRAQIETIIAERTRDEWATVFKAYDACATPVLSFEEALREPQNQARRAFVQVEGIDQPAPAPRYTYQRTIEPHLSTAKDLDRLLQTFGMSPDEAAARAGALLSFQKDPT